MAVEIVDVTEAPGGTASYTYNTKSYGVIVGLAIGTFNGNGYLRITNSAGVVVHQINSDEFINDSTLTKTYQSNQWIAGGIFRPILLSSGDVISVDGTVVLWDGGMRIVAADTLWEASLFM
jgi:hypothetical protein